MNSMLRWWWIFAVATSGSFAGCAASVEEGGAPLTLVAATPESAGAGAINTGGELAAPAASAGPAVEGDKKPGEKPLAVASKDVFQPPYPQRENMFRRPNADNLMKTARPENTSDVELKGFVNIDGVTKAVLALDGKTITVRQGEHRGEIEVIEISPPKAILQRGRTRWTTHLFSPTENKSAQRAG